MTIRYMKKYLWAILAVLLILLAAFIFFYEPQAEEREFRGTFVGGFYGHLHQANEESEYSRTA